MSRRKFAKRLMKLKGGAWYGYSGLMLRYTSWHARRLAKFVEGANVDRLHAGCGDVILSGWLNVLYERRMEYGRVSLRNGGYFLNYNLLQPWPVADGSLRYIAGSHFIEHMDLHAGMLFARQAFQAAAPGAVIRLSCPDLETYARHYLAGDRAFFEHPLIREWCAFKAAVTPGEIFAAKAYDSGGAHKWFYDFASLKHILEAAGFSAVRRVGRLEGRMPDLDHLEPPGRELETVYVEAQKPLPG